MSPKAMPKADRAARDAHLHHARVDAWVERLPSDEVLAKVWTGVDTAPCVLCAEPTTTPDRVCKDCNNAHNEDELRAGGWESSYGIEQEGWT